jgi:hypothetical protein
MAKISRPLSGRAGERAILERLAKSAKSEFLAVYGRRRVGKTFLIRRFFQDQPVVYFEMVGRVDGTLEDHLRIFSESLAATFHRGANLAPPESWHDAFRALEASIEAQKKTKRKLVLFFDELPWIATHRSGCLEELEHFWNAWCSRRDDIILIVCGSAASWMLRRILENLEEGGFINSTIPFGRTARDRFFRLTDEFCLFHLKWMATNRPRSWHTVAKSSSWQAWAGLAFESVCLAHARAVERALGISGVRTSVSAWLHNDAQIDMLIDRADGVVSIIEIKFTDGPFAITRKYADELRNKIAVFRAETALKKAVHLVFVTSYGVVQNQYAADIVDATVMMDALLQ